MTLDNIWRQLKIFAGNVDSLFGKKIGHKLHRAKAGLAERNSFFYFCTDFSGKPFKILEREEMYVGRIVPGEWQFLSHRCLAEEC